jgi:hypothetical protein
MSVKGLKLSAAVQWITSRYEVPAVAKGKHIQHQERWPERYRIGTSGPALDTLVRSGIWASLTPAQCKILPVLDTFADETHRATISYRGMMRYAGIQSQSTVATALKRFRALRFLRVEVRRDGNGFRECNTYRLCFDDPDFIQLANDSRQRQAEQINQERAFREYARRQRKAAQLLPVNTLSTG